MIAKHLYSYVSDDESDAHKCLREELDFMQSEILRVHMTLMNYALERGYSYCRWQTIANSVLFKEPGNIRIHRTRIIHIYEADYNLMLGLKWRSALLQAEALNQLNSGQFGSRPRHNATDPVFMEELQLELSRITRKTVALTNYDATACYDRIIPNLAMLASRKFGVAESVTVSNASTLEKAEYRIRTDIGLATVGYQHSSDYPIYGTGQGSGNSPVIWCFISSILYDCYEEMAQLAKYNTPDHSRHIELGMIGYVDDSNGQTNTFYDPVCAATSLLVKDRMKNNANVWSTLLGISGGALELSKCSYHLVSWKFASSGAPVLCNEKEMFGGVLVTDALTGDEHELQYLSPYEAHKTLGHYKEPAGTQVTQFRKLLEKSNELTSFLWSNHLTREEAWTFYFSTYLPSLSYPLANSHFTERQLTKIQKKAMSIIFAKCGYNRNTKREVLFGPLEFGGANFRRLYDQQGIGQLCMFLRHWRSQTQVGDLLRILLAWCNYAAGLSLSVLEDTRTVLPHLESKWLASLREYLRHIGASIQVDNSGIPPLEREHDRYIMDEVIRSGQFVASEIRKINYCRLFLNAATLSDLTDTAGSTLDRSKLTGAPTLQSSRSRWMSIHQENPSKAEWRLWKKANQLWSTSSGDLDVPLGKWLQPHRIRRVELFAYHYRNRLVVRVLEGYVVCRKRSDGLFCETSKVIRYQEIPNDAVPATVEYEANLHWRVVHICEVLPTIHRMDWSTFSSFIDSLDPWENDLLRNTRMNVDPRLAVLELQNNFLAGSDGSSKFQTQGAFGWVVSTSSGERIATGNGPSRGATVDSYRAECSGLLAILRFLIRLAEYTDMVGIWSGRIGTDSQSLLDRAFEKHGEKGYPVRYGATSLKVLDVLDPEWDLLNEIQITLRRLPEVTLEYVKGHQDDHVEYSRLSMMAQLNVDADGLATLYQQEFGSTRPLVLLSDNAGAHLITQEGTVTSKLVPTVRYLSTGPSLRQYIMKKNDWTEQIMRSINWKVHAKFLKHNIARRVHFSKMVHECLPTNSMRNRFDSGRRHCPICPCEHETRDHILRCPDESRTVWRDHFMRQLEIFHSHEDTCPFLRHLLREAITQWFAEAERDITVSPILFPIDVREVILQQNAIGWRQLFNARFSCEWSRVQSAHYNRRRGRGSRRQMLTGDGWLLRLTKMIGDNWLELWRQRNNDVHGYDRRTQEAAERREVSRQLEEIYRQRMQYEPRVQSLLLPDVQEHLLRPTWVTRNWLATNAGIFRESMKRAKARALQGVQTLHAFFPKR